MSKVHALFGKVRFTDRGHDLFSLLNYAMVGVLGVVFACWTWVLLAPAPLPTPATLPAGSPVLAPAIASAHWFGGGAAAGAVTQNVNYKLLGVYASDGEHPGFAILQQADGKQIVAVLHQAFVPGLVLQSISGDSVTIDNSGAPMSLKMEAKAANAKPAARLGP